MDLLRPNALIDTKTALLNPKLIRPTAPVLLAYLMVKELLMFPWLFSVRIAILQKFTEFHKTKALNDGVGYIKVKYSRCHLLFSCEFLSRVHISISPALLVRFNSSERAA